MKYKHSLMMVLVLVLTVISPASAEEVKQIEKKGYIENSSDQEIVRDSIIINRCYSTYSDTAPYRNQLRYRMNCYGYALHVYSNTGNWLNPYKQQPGEFATDGQSFADQNSEMISILSSTSYSASYKLSYLKSKIESDFATLASEYDSEWSISTTTATASVPSGSRKIALAIGGGDYHFYMRHSDGTWSHKPGAASVTNKGLSSTNVTITDSNIGSLVSEGGYNEGVMYFLISKAAVIDYQHYNGHGSTTLRTATGFLDRAGESLTRSKTIPGTVQSARFDYPGDEDCYVFYASTAGSYTITTSLTSTSYNANMYVYDTYGNIIASESASGNPNLVVSLTAGERCFIKVYEANQAEINYAIYIYH